jgi:hypothetical protein
VVQMLSLKVNALILPQVMFKTAIAFELHHIIHCTASLRAPNVEMKLGVRNPPFGCSYMTLTLFIEVLRTAPLRPAQTDSRNVARRFSRCMEDIIMRASHQFHRRSKLFSISGI